ncbi:MAG: hypothetical protein RMX96_12155 [Nostoc sp. ChiSLP02]|nr:hypothetical protein [Nostoc sp. ChiSLP02]
MAENSYLLGLEICKKISFVGGIIFFLVMLIRYRSNFFKDSETFVAGAIALPTISI